jgi:hypothetical protein
MKTILKLTCVAIIPLLFSCGASRKQAEKERKFKEKSDQLDADKKKFEQQNPQAR